VRSLSARKSPGRDKLSIAAPRRDVSAIGLEASAALAAVKEEDGAGVGRDEAIDVESRQLVAVVNGESENRQVIPIALGVICVA
jgi:hypothetical protein